MSRTSTTVFVPLTDRQIEIIRRGLALIAGNTEEPEVPVAELHGINDAIRDAQKSALRPQS